MNSIIYNKNSSINSITVECNCIGKCSYLRLIDTKVPERARYSLDIIKDTLDKKERKRLAILQSRSFGFDVLNEFNDVLKKAVNVGDNITRTVYARNGLIIVIHIMHEYDNYQLVFYNNNKDYIKDLSAYDICMTRAMLLKLTEGIDKLLSGAINEHRV